MLTRALYQASFIKVSFAPWRWVAPSGLPVAES
jgi:hypothetical protein